MVPPSLRLLVCLADTTQISQTGELKHQTFISPGFRGCEVQDQGTADLISGEGSDSWTAIFLLCRHTLEGR